MAKKRIEKRPGPQIGAQSNAHLIREAHNQAKKLTTAQKQALVDAAEGNNEDGESGKGRKRASRAIADQAVRPSGGSTIHHCALKKHSNQERCIRGGCLDLCKRCGTWVSIGYGSRCRVCERREMEERVAEQNRKKEEAERKRLAEEVAAREAERRSGRKAKWQKHEKEEKARQFREGHKKQQRDAGGAFMVQVYGSRVPKRGGRVGEKGGGGNEVRDEEVSDIAAEGFGGSQTVKRADITLTPQEEDELTIEAALVLLEYCQDLLQAVYVRRQQRRA